VGRKSEIFDGSGVGRKIWNFPWVRGGEKNLIRPPLFTLGLPVPPPPLLNLDQVHLSRVRIAKQQLDPSLPLCIWTIFFQTSRSINKQFYLW
jgi:hypothetical protein